MDINNIIQNLNFTNVAWQIATPLLFSLFDIITGYLQARINNDVKSQVMREGLIHKFLLIIIILIGFIFQYSFGINGISVVICAYICIMEITSISENLQKAGINLKIFEIFLGKGDKKLEYFSKLLSEIRSKKNDIPS